MLHGAAQLGMLKVDPEQGKDVAGNCTQALVRVATHISHQDAAIRKYN